MVLCQCSQPVKCGNVLICTGQTSDLKILWYSYAIGFSLVSLYVTMPILIQYMDIEASIIGNTSADLFFFFCKLLNQNINYFMCNV